MIRAVKPFVIVALTMLLIVSSTGVVSAQGEQLLFDHFEGSSLNTSLWYFGHNNPDATYSIGNSILDISGGYTDGGGGMVYSQGVFTPGSDILSFETSLVVSGNDSGDDAGFWGFIGAYRVHDGHAAFFVNRQGELGVVVRPDENLSNLFSTVIPGIDPTVWHTYRIELTDSEARFYVDNTLVLTNTQHVPGSKPLRLVFDQSGRWAVLHMFVDYVELWRVPLEISVAIDIKPGSDPNCFNNDGHGVIPVAIFSTGDFDATQIDPTTVSLDGQGVRVVGRGNTQAHFEDVNGDGLLDLVVQIEDLDGTYETGDAQATLSGTTYNGTPFAGTDSICIVP